MSLNSQKEYWNGRYSAEGSIWGKSPSLSAERAVKVFKDADAEKILVPGCGYGRNALHLSRMGLHVLALDISDKAIKIANDSIDNLHMPIEFKCADILAEEFNEPFDGILSINMLHLYDEAARNRILEKYKKNLRDDAPLVLTCMSTNDPDFGKGQKVAHNTFESKKGRPICYFDEVSMKSLISQYFEPVVIEEIIEYENHGGKEHYHSLIYVIATK